ncbi:MAG: 2-oxoacid:acceptor oxidoreductase family protein [Parcubacteria group bacterium]
MTEIRLHGRGGQGTVTAAELLAKAAFYDGKHSQAFPSFGVERRGAPVSAFCRIDDKPIRLREQIYNPDYIIIQDPGLIGTDPQILSGAEKCRGILINSSQDKSAFVKTTADALRNKNVVAINATEIAIKYIGKPFFNTALCAAFSAMTGIVGLESLKKAAADLLGEDVLQANIDSMEVAFDYIKKLKHEYLAVAKPRFGEARRNPKKSEAREGS